MVQFIVSFPEFNQIDTRTLELMVAQGLRTVGLDEKNAIVKPLNPLWYVVVGEEEEVIVYNELYDDLDLAKEDADLAVSNNDCSSCTIEMLVPVCAAKRAVVFEDL